MSHVCKCDLCGKVTYINPPHEMEYEEIEVDGKKMQKPVTAKMKRQNPYTQKIEEIEVPKRIDLKPRAYMIQLQIGPSEMIQRDFCIDCLQIVKSDLVKVWNILEKIIPQ